MTAKERESIVAEVITALKDFIVRATKESATPEEVATLPEVAKALLNYDVELLRL